MKRRNLVWIAGAALALLPSLPAAAQDVSSLVTPPAAGVFSGGPSAPLSVRLGDLNGDWRRLTISGNQDFGNLTQIVTQFLSSTGFGIYYTKGQTVSLGSETYLIAYRTHPKSLDIASLGQSFTQAAMTQKPPTPEVLTADTPLQLSLLNLRTCGSLNDVRPFDLAQELAASKASADIVTSLFNMLSEIDKPSAPKPHPVKPKPRPKKSSAI